MRLLSPFSAKSFNPLLIYFPGMDGTGQLFHRQGEKLKDFFSILILILLFIYVGNPLGVV